MPVPFLSMMKVTFSLRISMTVLCRLLSRILCSMPGLMKFRGLFSHGSDILDLQAIPVGAEIEGIGADDLEELSEDENEYYKLGAEDEEFKDYKNLGLKLDHANRSSTVSHFFRHMCGCLMYVQQCHKLGNIM